MGGGGLFEKPYIYEINKLKTQKENEAQRTRNTAVKKEITQKATKKMDFTGNNSTLNTWSWKCWRGLDLKCPLAKSFNNSANEELKTLREVSWEVAFYFAEILNLFPSFAANAEGVC